MPKKIFYIQHTQRKLGEIPWIMIVKIIVFWDIRPCSLANEDSRFRRNVGSHAGNYMLNSGTLFPTNSVVMWSQLTWFMWSDFILKWNEVGYGEVLREKSAMYIRVTLYWGYLFIMWLFNLVCILYCGCFNLFRNVRAWVCVLVFW